MTENLPAKTKVMQNAVILELIAKKMDVEDLRPLRRTCPLWNQPFVPAVRDKQEVITLCCADQSEPDQDDKNTLGSYLEVMRTSQDIPVTKYCLDDLLSARHQDQKEFFDLCGPSLTRLDLYYYFDSDSTSSTVTPAHIEKIRQIIFEQTPNLMDLRLVFNRDQLKLTTKNSGGGGSTLTLARDLPNLRKLRFCVTKPGEPDTTEEWDPVIKSLLAELLRHATGLKSFSCRSYLDHDGINNLEVLSVLRDHASKSCLSNLTTFKIGKLDVADLDILVDLGLGSSHRRPLRLRALVISIECTNERQEQIMQKLHQFLETQARSLRHLCLDIQTGWEGEEEEDFEQDQLHLEPFEATTIRLPIMPRVQCFCLNRQDPDHLLLLEPLTVKFPGLVRFEYLLNHNDYLHYFRTNGEDDVGGLEHSRVTDLRLDTNFLLLPGDNELFQRVYGAGFQFQLITRLEIWLRPSRQYIFTQICSVLPSLEVLQVVFRLRGYDDFEHHEKTRENDDLGRAGVKGEGNDDGGGGEVDLELDSLLSGVSRNNLGNLRQDLVQLKAQAAAAGAGVTVTATALQNILDNYKTESGVQDLHHLQKLVLAIDWYRCRLTDAGGYFGLALASHTLQHIVIGDGLNTNVEDRQKEGHIKTGRNNECAWSADVLVSEECQAMIRSVMSPPAVLLLF